MKVKHALGALVIILLITLVVVLIPKKKTGVERGPVESFLNENDKLAPQRTPEELKAMQDKLQRALRKVDDAVSKLKHQKELQQKKVDKEGKKLQKLKNKMEKREEKMIKEEEDLDNWKEDQEGKYDDERDDILENEMREWEKLDLDERLLESAADKADVEKISVQNIIKADKKKYLEHKKEGKNILEDKIELAKDKKKLSDIKIKKVDISKKLAKVKAQKKSAGSDVKHKEKERRQEIRDELIQLKKKIEKDRKNQQELKKKINKIKNSIKEDRHKVYISKTTGNKKALKQEEKALKEKEKELEKEELNAEREREWEDQDLASLGEKQVEEKASKVEEDEFELNKYENSEDDIDDQLLQVFLKEQELSDDIAQKEESGPLSKDEDRELNAEKQELKQLGDLETIKRSQAKFYSENAPDLAKNIHQEKKEEVKAAVDNIKKELELKKKHKAEIEKEKEQVAGDIREIVQNGNSDDPAEQLELQKKQKREKELNLNLEFENEDETELNAELSEDESISKGNDVLYNDRNVLASLKRDARDSMEKLEHMDNTEENKQYKEELSKKLKQDSDTEKKVRLDMINTIKEIEQVKKQQQFRKQEIAKKRSDTFEEQAASDKKNVDRLETRVQMLSSDTDDIDGANEELEIANEELEIAKQSEHYDERRDEREKKESIRARRAGLHIEKKYDAKIEDASNKEQWAEQRNKFRQLTNEEEDALALDDMKSADEQL